MRWTSSGRRRRRYDTLGFVVKSTTVAACLHQRGRRESQPASSACFASDCAE